MFGDAFAAHAFWTGNGEPVPVPPPPPPEPEPEPEPVYEASGPRILLPIRGRLNLRIRRVRGRQ